MMVSGLSLVSFVSCLIFSQDALADLYDDLGLESSATPDQIKNYWKLWRASFHPDKHTKGDKGLSLQEAHKIFVFINEEELTLEEIRAVDDPELESYKYKKIAFYILRDPDLRKQYDEWLNSPGYKEALRRQSQETAGKGNSGQDHASGLFLLLYRFGLKIPAFVFPDSRAQRSFDLPGAS